MLLVRVVVGLLGCVVTNLLGVLATAYLLQWGMDQGLSFEEIARNLSSMPSIELAAAESVLLLAVSAPFLARGGLWLLALISSLVGPYYYVLFFSYYVWGNDFEPWLDLHVGGIATTILFPIVLVLPYALAPLAQWVMLGQRRNRPHEDVA